MPIGIVWRWVGLVEWLRCGGVAWVGVGLVGSNPTGIKIVPQVPRAMFLRGAVVGLGLLGHCCHRCGSGVAGYRFQEGGSVEVGPLFSWFFF